MAGYLKASTLAVQQAALSASLEETKGEIQRGLEQVKLDTERLKSAHAKQFDKEFKLYEDFWKHLFTLMSHARRLGDDDLELSSIVTKEDEIAKNQKDVLIAMEPVQELILLYAPFIHKRVHVELQTLADMCNAAWINEVYVHPNLPGFPKPPPRGREIGQKIEDQLWKICEEIRWRIGLSNIDWEPLSAPK